MSIADTWSEDAFVRLMQDLIGSEGGLHAAADNNDRREPESSQSNDDAGSVVALQG
ncbi:hypothetical protein V4833_21935 [Enterobacter sp. HK169]|uniref:hypothetical protein n=1 Tax=Enterobacter sp. HK169 TaxID=1868135 RepID=UPI002F421289